MSLKIIALLVTLIPFATANEPRAKRAFGRYDRVDQVILGEIIQDLQVIEDRGLNVGATEFQPWSDSYWPIQKGILASRYADPEFPNSRDWAANYAYSQSRPAAQILASGDQAAIDRLSPAEKYDILVGDMEFTFTRKMWEKGEYYYNRYGNVPGWMGVCHGWAAASTMEREPRHEVTLTSAHGIPVRFFISDIKALLSALWAYASPRPRFVGGTCDEPTLERDAAGRIVSNLCFDTNPGAWHLTVVNQIGKNRFGFIIDATNSSEVWNHPVYSYRYTYFNPQTLEPVSRFRQARIPITAFTRDKFSDLRSPQTESVVGITMEITYMSEMMPNHAQAHRAPITRTATYVYDLELNAQGQIIGGEWYSDKHPDFIWTYRQGTRPASRGDLILGERVADWDPANPVPADWLEASRASANIRGEPAPLAQIVYTLLELSLH